MRSFILLVGHESGRRVTVIASEVKLIITTTAI